MQSWLQKQQHILRPLHNSLYFLFERLVLAIITLFCVATCTFLLMHYAPGDPFLDEACIPAETLLQIRTHYGLEDPLFVQYIRYLKSIFVFDLGPSLKYTSQTVNQIIAAGFPISARLGLQALCLAIPCGIILGTITAFFSKGLKNCLAIAGTVLGISVPTFVTASILQLLFAVYYPLFPVARMGTFLHTVLPTISLAISPTCYIARMLRANILEILNMPYIQMAKIKGLCFKRIFIYHILKNAILPIFGYLGPVVTNILVGSCIVERVFGISGLGQWFVTGVLNRDYPLIAGLTIFYSVILFVNHTLIDFFYRFIDPRISFMKRDIS